MKPVFTDSDITRVTWFQLRLEEEGIPTFIRNQHLHNLATWVPVPAFYPTLCVVQDEDEERAKRLLGEYQAETGGEGAWTCPACGASVPDNFAECWKCKGAKPA